MGKRAPGKRGIIKSTMPTATVTPEMPIAEAGRLLMSNELSTVQTHWPALRLSAEVTAVHETRKAIRRTLTLLKLFTPYFAPGVLEPHRVTLRGIMRRLGPCRDVAVFRLKLGAFNETAERPLTQLTAYWQEQQAEFDKTLCRYLARKKVRRHLETYARFTTTPGVDAMPRGEKITPLQVRHALPALLFQRAGAVRAWGELLPEATPTQFHQLRIRFKELRYTLTFFEPVLSAGGEMIDLSRRIQEYLGDLNDAGVALSLLTSMKGCREEKAIYSAHQQAELERLTGGFLPLYAEFDRPEVRVHLAQVAAEL